MTLLLGIEWAKRDFDKALAWAKECDDAAIVATLLGASLAGNRDITPSVESWLRREPQWRDLKADNETILQVAQGHQKSDSAAALRYIDSSAGPSPSERLQMRQEQLLRQP